MLPAGAQKLRGFSIRTGDVLHELRIGGHRAPAVCSALKTRRFLRENHLRLVQATGPKSGQSTTVTYTYEFLAPEPSLEHDDPWKNLRGSLKDIFAESGGGEAYLRSERNSFQTPGGKR